MAFSPKAGATFHKRQQELGMIDPALTQPIQLPSRSKEEHVHSSLRSSQNRRSTKLKDYIAASPFNLNGGTQRAAAKLGDRIDLNITAPLQGLLNPPRYYSLSYG